MRILLVNAQGADRAYGGAERYVRELRDGLSARGEEVAVLAAFPAQSDDSRPLWTLHRRDWRTSRAQRAESHLADWLALLPRGADAALDGFTPDLVHTNALPGISTGIWELARRRGIPVVHTIHDYHLLCPRSSLTRRDGSPCHPSPALCGARSRRLARWQGGVDSVIGVSDHVLARHRAFLRATTPTRVVRPPRVPVPGARSEPPSRLASVGFLGALTADKGVETLIEAAPELRRRGIACRIAGDGPLRDRVRAAADVDYAGRLEGEDVGRFLMTCDLGIVASRWEDPAPFTPLEWMAAGRPVLTTGLGGLSELAAAGGTRTFDGSAAGLVTAVDALTAPGALTALAETVPATDGTADRARWLGEHLEVYGSVVVTAGDR